MRRLAVLALSLALATGCTAVKSTFHVMQADAALAGARDYNAQELAVYEYTMAQRYLEKAREEMGGSDYKMSERLARRSMEWSDRAIIVIEGGNRGLESMGDDLRDFGPRPQSDDADPATGDPVLTSSSSDEQWFEPTEPVETPAPAPEPEPEPEGPDPGDEFSDDDEIDFED